MDTGRKDITDKASEKITPDSSKSTFDQAKEGITGAGDKAARDIVPDDQKSTSQSVSDKFSREKDTTKSNESVLDKAKDAVGMGNK